MAIATFHVKLDVLRTEFKELEQRLTARMEANKLDITAKFDSLDQRINAKFDALDQRISSRFDLLKWMFGLLITLFIGLVIRLLFFPAK